MDFFLRHYRQVRSTVERWLLSVTLRDYEYGSFGTLCSVIVRRGSKDTES